MNANTHLLTAPPSLTRRQKQSNFAAPLRPIVQLPHANILDLQVPATDVLTRKDQAIARARQDICPITREPFEVIGKNAFHSPTENWRLYDGPSLKHFLSTMAEQRLESGTRPLYWSSIMNKPMDQDAQLLGLPSAHSLENRGLRRAQALRLAAYIAQALRLAAYIGVPALIAASMFSLLSGSNEPFDPPMPIMYAIPTSLLLALEGLVMVHAVNIALSW